jgi:putative transcriptional regulator
MQGAEETRECAEVTLRTGTGNVFGGGKINYECAGQAPRGNGPPGETGMIEVRLHELIAARGITLAELSHRVGVTVVNLSVLKNGRARAIRFSTLARLCEALDCQPGDLLSWRSTASEQPPASGERERMPAERMPAERMPGASSQRHIRHARHG